ncbi:MAG: hypothetical protein V4581_08475 [Bacteroidota bacterium]
MIVQISEAFPHINQGCLTSIYNQHTFIFEDKERHKGLFVADKDKYHLHIQNNTNKSFHFLQNDNCVMKNARGGQCDYVVLNDFKIVFTDVKVAKGNFSNHRTEAYNQIENTFKHYSNLVSFPKEYDLEALVCFPSPRRIIKASASTKRKDFKVNYNINLSEGNYILFE